ncbi:MAG: hypothetical protein H6667_11760 [Ardenticatenaceae bacterium]|nr:hypothetical protein [Ardenticatenaceae bacterium]MCB9446190.1 hypothetical protein [Ardenticatenaceae bacterium]
MNKRLGLIILVFGLMLAACGGSTTAVSTTTSGLNDNYENALSVQSQLALGTIQLTGDGLAVDEAQAAELLPLWRALQSLSASDTTAEIELNAVVNQIEDSMTANQIQAIAAMVLTSDDIAALMQNSSLSNMGDVSSGQSESSNLTLNPGGGPPAGSDFGGGVPGGMPGDMAGMTGTAVSDTDTTNTTLATGGPGDMQETMLTNAVINFLAQASGVVEN